MDPKHCTPEEMAFLMNKNNELEDKLVKMAAAYEEHRKAYSLLERVNERLRSEQALSKPVEAAVVKGFVDMAVDTSKKEAKEIVEDANYYKEKFKKIECHNAELKRKLSVCEQERNELLAFKKNLRDQAEHADMEECKKRFQEMEHKYQMLESRASKWKNECYKQLENQGPKEEKKFIPHYSPDPKEGGNFAAEKPIFRQVIEGGRPKIDEGFLNSAVNRHITPVREDRANLRRLE